MRDIQTPTGGVTSFILNHGTDDVVTDQIAYFLHNIAIHCRITIGGTQIIHVPAKHLNTTFVMERSSRSSSKRVVDLPVLEICYRVLSKLCPVEQSHTRESG
jgi:hypothetical protein